MIISFDIDNTLIPYADEFETEEKNFYAKLFKAEGIRKGTIFLFNKLEKEGHECWIYTTSFRTVFNLRKTFWCYGLKPHKIIRRLLWQHLNWLQRTNLILHEANFFKTQ